LVVRSGNHPHVFEPEAGEGHDAAQLLGKPHRFKPAIALAAAGRAYLLRVKESKENPATGPPMQTGH
jgi:hypothetical protein